ncbi:pyridoxal phosphate-dependent aminotransferase [Fodinicurvata sp. EGI_FJ10296]|uniref:pyridoxal phosphate-dependent aminotransferase n=1 Tax=Fodinicurvata sp. EGI_FJ10296 TaxID=3231908 RepID=UPI003453731C
MTDNPQYHPEPYRESHSAPALKVADRAKVSPFIVMDVMSAAARRAETHGDVLHLEVGQPATPAPEGVRRAAKTAIDTRVLGYTVAFGIPELRARIARHYGDAYGVSVSPDRIAVTTGSSSGFQLAFLAAFEPGDRVALVAPGYPAYRNILSALGCVPVEIPAGPETRFQPTPDLLDAWQREHGERLAGLIVASPSNPAGTMVSPDEMRDLADYCQRAGIRLVSDEIYHGITFARPATTALSVSGSAIVINSFSKYYSMTGWRLGWMVLPEDLVRPIECLAQNMFISSPSVSQYAAIAAFDCTEELEANLAVYRVNRDLLLESLPKAGFGDLAPADGAFYIYADVSHLTDDSPAFCRRILDETGIAVTPGVDFDTTRGHRTLRFSFAGSTADMGEAMERLTDWVR